MFFKGTRRILPRGLFSGLGCGWKGVGLFESMRAISNFAGVTLAHVWVLHAITPANIPQSKLSTGLMCHIVPLPRRVVLFEIHSSCLSGVLLRLPGISSLGMPCGAGDNDLFRAPLRTRFVIVVNNKAQEVAN